MDTSLILIILAEVAAVGVGAAIFMALTHNKLQKRYQELKEQKEDRGALREDASEIIHEAEGKAKEILHQAEVLKKDTGAHLEVELSKVTEEEIEKFKSTLAEARAKAVEMVAASARAMVEEAKKLTDDEYDRIREEVERYKKQRLESIDQEVERVVKDLAKKVFASSIDPSKHEELIIKAIKAAKKENVL